MSASTDIARRLVEILRQTALEGSEREFQMTDSLGEEGLGLDSLGMVQFLTAVEKEYSVKLPVAFWSGADSTSVEDCVMAVSREMHGRGPHTDTEQRLAGIWHRVTGNDPASVDDSLAGDPESRALWRSILAEAKKEFGIYMEGVAVQEFELKPTIRKLAAAIEAGTAQSSSIVVPLQSSGGGKPLFLVHAGGGYVYFYRALAARLRGDRPVYGIRAAVAGDRDIPPFETSRDLEELAKVYLAQMRKLQRHGPYHLGGACFGGAVAFEMTRQLLAAGESIGGPLLLFDAILKPPVSEEGHIGQARKMGGFAAIGYLVRVVFNEPAILTRYLRRLMRSAWQNAMRLVLKGPHDRAAQDPGGAGSGEQAGKQVFDRFMLKAGKLLEKYQPRPLQISAVLIRAENGPVKESDWKSLVLGGLDTHLMRGEHLDMMEEPAVFETAERVRRDLAS